MCVFLDSISEQSFDYTVSITKFLILLFQQLPAPLAPKSNDEFRKRNYSKVVSVVSFSLLEYNSNWAAFAEIGQVSVLNGASQFHFFFS